MLSWLEHNEFGDRNSPGSYIDPGVYALSPPARTRHVPDMTTYRGSCLCGAVNFELAGEPFRYAICYCYNCRVSGGGAFMTNAFFKSQNMTISKGQDSIKTYRDANTKTGNALLRSFCSNCGSSVFLAPAAGGLAIVQAGAVEGSEAWVPTHESHPDAKWKWIKELEIHPKKPTSRARL